MIDRLDGTNDVYAPKPQADVEDARDRSFERLAERVDGLAVEERIKREMRFDPDVWVVVIEDREGRAFLD